MRYVVGVMGPAKARRKDLENARALGELIARREWVLLTGGRDVGVMHAAALALKAGKEVVLLGATPVEEKFFKNLGGRLISSVQTPEDAINAILRRFERGNISTLQAPEPWGGC